jgi:hypothetical protein
MGKTKLINTKPAKFAAGGNTKMFGKQHAGPRKSLSQSGTAQVDSGPGGKFAKGGSTHMFGKQSAGPRRSGVTGK